MLSNSPEVELLPHRPSPETTVARCEMVYREYGVSSPISGQERLRHEVLMFKRTARMLMDDAAAGDLHDLDDYLPMEPPC